MSDPGVVEVRCEACQCSFAPETRQCIHCGGALGPGRLFRAVGQRDLGPESGSERGESLFEVEQEDENAELPGRGRNLVWAFTAAAFMLLSALRNCGAVPG